MAHLSIRARRRRAAEQKARAHGYRGVFPPPQIVMRSAADVLDGIARLEAGDERLCFRVRSAFTEVFERFAAGSRRARERLGAQRARPRER